MNWVSIALELYGYQDKTKSIFILFILRKYFLDKWLFTVLSQHTLLEYKVSWNAFSSRGSGNMTEEATQKEGKERKGKRHYVPIIVSQPSRYLHLL